MAVLADKCPEIQVTVVDINEERINAWNSHDPNNFPVYEPKLEDVLKKCRDNSLI